jgi:4-hydroxy-3-methylbut-2-enyl diphosphate reductase
MRVIRADVMGLCFGVHDALAVIDGVASPSEVTIHGELVHNEVVLADLQSRGFRMSGESDRSGVPDTPAVLITAHGVSDHERRRLEAAGKTLIDTTCPLVARVHQAATRLESQGYHVLVIGRRSHVEVRGVVEDLSRFDVIESADEVTSYADERLGIVCQTTAPEALVSRVREGVAR